jgi:hypothetical protein
MEQYKYTDNSLSKDCSHHGVKDVAVQIRLTSFTASNSENRLL